MQLAFEYIYRLSYFGDVYVYPKLVAYEAVVFNPSNERKDKWQYKHNINTEGCSFYWSSQYKVLKRIYTHQTRLITNGILGYRYYRYT